mgnify:CR=1 FL=1
MRSLRTVFLVGLSVMLLALSACEQIAPEPAPSDPRAPRATGEMCGGIAGFSCASDSDYCQMPTGGCRIADGAGKCAIRPQVCTREYRPVCGCNGETYGNACTAASAGANIAHEGQCRE